jgi:protein SCO1/2
MTTPTMTEQDRSEVDPCRSTPPIARRRWWVRPVPLLGAILAGLVFALVVVPRVFDAATPHLYHATVLQQTEPAPAMTDLELVDGSPVDLTAFDGDVVLVYFGYLGCPDVCPTTLALAARAIDDLPADKRENVHLLMVTVDPDRDGAQEIDEYVKFFHHGFLGARGDTADTRRVASQYGIFYELGEPDDDGDYFLDHTATLMAVDAHGTLRLVWAPDVTAGEVTADLQELVS